MSWTAEQLISSHRLLEETLRVRKFYDTNVCGLLQVMQIAKEMLHTNFDTSTKFADTNSCSKYFNSYDKVSI